MGDNKTRGYGNHSQGRVLPLPKVSKERFRHHGECFTHLLDIAAFSRGHGNSLKLKSECRHLNEAQNERWGLLRKFQKKKQFERGRACYGPGMDGWRSEIVGGK